MTGLVAPPPLAHGDVGDEGRGESGAGAFLGRQGIWSRRIQGEHLAAGPQRKSQAFDYRGGANPAAVWGGGDQVAFPVDRIQMGGVPNVGMTESEVFDRTGPDAECTRLSAATSTVA
jgi:hypothetical protein